MTPNGDNALMERFIRQRNGGLQSFVNFMVSLR